MLGKRQHSSTEDNPPPSKKQKVNDDDNKNDNNDNDDDVEFDVMANLDLDLNIVVGRGNKRRINLNFFSDKMKEIQIDSHIYFQFNADNEGHNILWKNKVVINSSIYSKYQDLIRSEHDGKYCHFHQPSGLQILEMYDMAPSILKKSESCGIILYNIHKSIMSTTSEDSYRFRDRKELQFTLTNLSINNNNNIIDIDTSSNNKKKQNKSLEIDDYGWKNNIFHQLSIKYRIAPILLIREFLKCNFGIKPDAAKQICILLTNIKIHQLNDIKTSIYKLYNISISISILKCIHYGILFDCIRGYNQKIAWNGWNMKMINTNNKILIDIFNKCKDRGSHFLEHTLIGKFRGIISKINKNIKNEMDKITILNETEQKMKISALKQQRIKFYREQNENDIDLDDDIILDKIGWIDAPTPDLLLNKPIMINGILIHWLDAKNFLITYQDKVKYRKIMKQINKYNKAFGNGALVCLGFVNTIRTHKNDLTLLDASYWVLNA